MGWPPALAARRRSPRYGRPPPFARDSSPIRRPVLPAPPRGPGDDYMRPRTPGGPMGAPPPGPAPAPKPPWSYESDPDYLLAKSGATSAYDRRKAANLANRKKVLLSLGSRELAAKILGADYAGLDAISDDESSMSTLGQIGRNYGETLEGTEEALNTGNVFYGGHRGKALRNLLYEKQRQTSGAISEAEAFLSGLSQDDLDALGIRDEAIRLAAAAANRRQAGEY